MQAAKQFFRHICALFACVLCVASHAFAYGHSTALGVNYPGADLKVFLSDNFSLEARGQYEDKIFTGGGRFYWYPEILGLNDTNIRPFIAAEGDYISFKGDYSKGTGTAFGGFCGLEYFITRRVSLQTDAGPMYITLNDGDTSFMQSGLEYVVNIGVNFYFK